jgi:hypothetical protein
MRGRSGESRENVLGDLSHVDGALSKNGIDRAFESIGYVLDRRPQSPLRVSLLGANEPRGGIDEKRIAMHQ